MTELRWLARLSGGHSDCFEDRPVQRVNVVLSRGVLALEAELACVRRSWSKTLAQRRTPWRTSPCATLSLVPSRGSISFGGALEDANCPV